MYRLFIAVPVPENIKERLLELKLNIPGTKWTPEDQLHITLKFIGEVDNLSFKVIKDSLSEIKMGQFPLGFKGVGSFSTGKSPKILWAGLTDNSLLKQLRNKIESTLNECGIKREGRKFSPHVTLARLRNPNLHNITEFLSTRADFRSESFIVEEFRLYSSKLYPRGAVHTIEAVYPLSSWS